MKIKKADQLSLLLYEENNSPKYFNISKKLLRFIFVIMPAISILAILSVLFLLVYIKGSSIYSERKTPRLVESLSKENLQLTKQIKELKQDAAQLEEKFATAATPSSGNYTPMQLFSAVPQNSYSPDQKLCAINDLKVVAENGKLSLNFLLANITDDARKLSGFIILAISDYSGISFYPPQIISPDNFEIKFNKGEPFAMEKLRPVTASFPLAPETKSLIIKVLIYSRLGEILLDKNIPHNL